jgi:hypothetical protein
MNDKKIEQISNMAFDWSFAVLRDQPEDVKDVANCSDEELEMFGQLLREHCRGLTK